MQKAEWLVVIIAVVGRDDRIESQIEIVPHLRRYDGDRERFIHNVGAQRLRLKIEDERPVGVSVEMTVHGKARLRQQRKQLCRIRWWGIKPGELAVSYEGKCGSLCVIDLVTVQQSLDAGVKIGVLPFVKPGSV